MEKDEWQKMIGTKAVNEDVDSMQAENQSSDVNKERG